VPPGLHLGLLGSIWASWARSGPPLASPGGPWDVDLESIWCPQVDLGSISADLWSIWLPYGVDLSSHCFPWGHLGSRSELPLGTPGLPGIISLPWGSLGGRSGLDLGSTNRSRIDFCRSVVDLASIWGRSGLSWLPLGQPGESIWASLGHSWSPWQPWPPLGVPEGSIWTRSGVHRSI
jgi:hypothetical protein